MQPPGAGSLVRQQSPRVHSNAAQHALLFSADGSKTSNKSPTPDLSTHPKWAKEIFLETKSSCRASVLALGHSRSAISSRFGLLSRAQGGSGPGGCSGARPAQHPPRWPLCHPRWHTAPQHKGGFALKLWNILPPNQCYYLSPKKITTWMAPAVRWFSVAGTGSGIKTRAGLKTIRKTYAK